jgi:ABC-type multidrug transport system fused ATPase/permease subunit
MNIKFEFATIGDVFESSFKLVLLSVAVAIVNYLIGDESGIVVILSLGIFFVSQFIRLLGMVSRYKVALEDLQSALPSLEVGREEIESVEKLADYIDESLDSIEDKYKADLEAVKVGLLAENTQQIDKMKALQLELAQQDIDLAQSKMELKKAWSEKTRLDNDRVGEIQQLKAELGSERERVKKAESLLREMEGFEVFISGDNEAIKTKYLSIIASNNAKQRNKDKDLVEVMG